MKFVERMCWAFFLPCAILDLYLAARAGVNALGGHWPKDSTEWAAWVGAVGTVGAVIAAILIAGHGQRQERKREIDREKNTLKSINKLCEAAAETVNKIYAASITLPGLFTVVHNVSYRGLIAGLCEQVHRIDVLSINSPDLLHEIIQFELSMRQVLLCFPVNGPTPGQGIPSLVEVVNQLNFRQNNIAELVREAVGS